MFTIANCYDVNPVTKARLGHLKMFTVTALATGAGSEVDLVITPPLIGAGAHKNCDFAVTDLDDDVVTWVPSTASTGYTQNMVFHKNAFALVTAPLEPPLGGANAANESYGGLSLQAVYSWNHLTMKNVCTLSILCGVKTLNDALALRLCDAS